MSEPVGTLAGSTCLGCGCTCDDIELVTSGAAIVEARRACTLGAAWFGNGEAPRQAVRDGRPCSVEEAIDAIARRALDAQEPLVYLAPDVTCEAQRAAVAIADLLRAALDSVSSVDLAHPLAMARRGRASATLGEIRSRADLLLFWGVDPDERYPRYRTRYAPDVPGLHVPDGRASRIVIAADVGDARGPLDADRRIAVPAGAEVEQLVRLAQALTLEWTSPPDQAAPGSALLDVAARIRAARYVAIVAEADAAVPRPGDRADALIALSFAVNAVTRGALSLLRGGGNRPGADAVTTWSTGFPAAVDFARGYPRFDPWGGTARARLASGAVDTVIVVGDAARIPAPLVALLETVPPERRCLVGPRASASALAPGATLVDTAVAGIHEGGTVLRMDDVPLPVRAAIDGPPRAREILQALCERIVAVQRDARPESHPAASMTGTASTSGRAARFQRRADG